MLKQMSFFLLILCLSVISPSMYAAPNNAQTLDHIIATVNDAVITQSELDQALRAVKRQFASTHTAEPKPAELRKKVLEQIINRKLQLQLAEQMGLRVSEAQLDHVVQDIARQNNVSLTQLYTKVMAEGLTKAAYRKEIREELIIEQLQQQEVGRKIIISPGEVRELSVKQRSTVPMAANKEYRVEDLLIPLPENFSAEEVAAANKKALTILAKLRAGVNLTEISAKHGLENIDLGWRKLTDIPSAFVNKVAMMKKGELAGPIRTANGVHIIYLTNVQSLKEHNRSPMPTQRQMQQQVFQQKYEKALQQWLSKLRSQAIINMHPG